MNGGRGGAGCGKDELVEKQLQEVRVNPGGLHHASHSFGLFHSPVPVHSCSRACQPQVISSIKTSGHHS